MHKALLLEYLRNANRPIEFRELVIDLGIDANNLDLDLTSLLSTGHILAVHDSGVVAFLVSSLVYDVDNDEMVGP